MKIEEKLYFAYGSNMNLDQMAYRCPAAEAVCTAKLEGYELFFAGRPGNGVASIRPKQGARWWACCGSLRKPVKKAWTITKPSRPCTARKPIRVRGSDGTEYRVTAYTMQEPYSRYPRNAVHGISGGDPCQDANRTGDR